MEKNYAVHGIYLDQLINTILTFSTTFSQFKVYCVSSIAITHIVMLCFAFYCEKKEFVYYLFLCISIKLQTTILLQSYSVELLLLNLIFKNVSYLTKQDYFKLAQYVSDLSSSLSPFQNQKLSKTMTIYGYKYSVMYTSQNG